MARSPSTYKVVVYGPARVGKTRFLDRLKENIFSDDDSETQGIEYLVLNDLIEGMGITLWDIGAFMGYSPECLSRIFNEAALCLFFVELSDYQNLTTEDFNKKYNPYLENIRDHHQGMPVIVIFSKRDEFCESEAAADWIAREAIAALRRRFDNLNIFSHGYITSARNNNREELRSRLKQIMTSLPSLEERAAKFDEEAGDIDPGTIISIEGITKFLKQKLQVVRGKTQQKKIVRDFFITDEATKGIIRRLSLGQLIDLFDMVRQSIKDPDDPNSPFSCLFYESGGFCFFGCVGATTSSQQVLRRIKQEVIQKLKSATLDSEASSFDGVAAKNIMRVIDMRVGRNFNSTCSLLFDTTTSHKRLFQEVRSQEKRAALGLYAC
ncbi:MAG: GTPase domain-containing protein [Gammaproteobacteria bacterium]|nr:GTPase domain-containing protein [Gammaproteobacteria bacterium]MCH9744253.1 GTPase domain-containing protein [Gammaproteobacteria bacterium]